MVALRPAALALGLLAIAAGCGSGGGGEPTHAPLPQILDLGGPLVSSPVVVPMLYQGDGDASAIARFTKALAGSAYWSGAVGPYGVGALTASVPPSPLPAPATTVTDDDFRQVLRTMYAQAPSSVNWSQTIFAFFPPAAASVSAPLGANGVSITLCQADAGYHSFVPLDAAHNAIYAVVARCPSFLGLSGLDVATGAASHELAEAATDPLGVDIATQSMTTARPAYGLPDDLAWSLLGGGEVGDLCANIPGAFYKDTGVAAVVQRLWSNAAAAQGHDPCGVAGPYFNAAPALSSTFELDGYGHKFTTPVVNIAVGSKVTVDVDLFADADVAGSWILDVFDMAQVLGQAPNLQLLLDRTTGKSGDVAHLAITVQSRGQLGGVDGLAGAVIVSKTTVKADYWPLLVKSN